MWRQVVTKKGTARCPQWHWGALTGGVGASALASVLEAWGLPHPLSGFSWPVSGAARSWSSQAGSQGLCLGALAHLGWERLFWAAREWPQTQGWGSCPELSYITLSYLIS